MKVIHEETFQHHNRVLAMPDSSKRRPSPRTLGAKCAPRIVLYLAWAVRVALVVLYIPVKVLSAIVQITYRWDLWASRIVTQTSEENSLPSGQREEPGTSPRGQVIQLLSKVQ